MKKLVVIGIPIYKQKLTEFEKISLQQVNKILNKYPRVFIAPQSLQFQYGKDSENIFIERFPDEYFKSTQSYSQLMLSDEFYKRFTEYKFLLIYQLDAFVFSDQLEKFCIMDYDYIGAPWNYATKTATCKSYVGNGGFSLRKVSAIRSLLKATKSLRLLHERADWWRKYEDHFFAFAGGECINGFNIAPPDIAAQFSFEGNVRRYYKRIHNKLPFGCHGWEKYDIHFYLPIMKRFGYEIDIASISSGDADKKNRKQTLTLYLCRRYVKTHNIACQYFQQALQKKMEQKTCSYGIFGYGAEGKFYLQVLLKDNIDVVCIFDNAVEKQGYCVDGLYILPLDIEYIRREHIVILVATSRYENEIIKQLQELGLKENKDFINLIALAPPSMWQYMKDYIIKI